MISGSYNFNFDRFEPYWGDSAQTGIANVIIGLKCTFSGVDGGGAPITASRSLDGRKSFDTFVTYGYLTGNAETICNEFASGLRWFDKLEAQTKKAVNKAAVRLVEASGENKVNVDNLNVAISIEKDYARVSFETEDEMRRRLFRERVLAVSGDREAEVKHRGLRN